jgi:Mn2+/Fe2+ NRAMP family transporter
LSCPFLQVAGSYRLIASIFKWLTLTLFAYIASAFFARPDWREVFSGTFLPTVPIDSNGLTILVAIFGTTISPYLFFWQASQEIEEEKGQGKVRIRERLGATDSELSVAAWDVNIGMLLSNVVMYFIILATAANLHASGQTDVQTAEDAAEALRPLAGGAATAFFALGLIGSGLLAVPILTTAGAYAVCEAFNWRHGLNEAWRQSKVFYVIIIASTMIGASINLLHVNPVKALVWTAVLNGILAPPLLALIMIMANSRDVMGDRTNGPVLNALGWIATALMTIICVGSFLAA